MHFITADVIAGAEGIESLLFLLITACSELMWDNRQEKMYGYPGTLTAIVHFTDSGTSHSRSNDPPNNE